MTHNRRPHPALVAIAVLALLTLAACDAPVTADEGHVLVFDYDGKFIPVEQLHKAPPDACDSSHWHGSGLVTTLRGENLSDPDPDCGFGKQNSMSIIEIPMPDDYQGVQRTDADWEFDN